MIHFIDCIFVATDLDDNADLRYALTYPSQAEDDRIFAIDQNSGDIVLQAPLINRVGKTYQMGVEATDKRGSRDGLTGSVQLEVFVLDHNYQLTMVLSNGVERVTQDLSNITRALSSVMGLEVGAHHVEQHRGGTGLGGDDAESSKSESGTHT